MRKVVDMIGENELALLIANAAVADTSIKIRPCNVAKVIGMSDDGARKRIDNTIIRSDRANGITQSGKGLR